MQKVRGQLGTAPAAGTAPWLAGASQGAGTAGTDALMRSRLVSSVNYERMLRTLRPRRVNYELHQVRGPAWNFDQHRFYLHRETPGEPEPDGSWQLACRLVADYEFSPPHLIRAVYHRNDPLLGRDMLLEGRFYGLRLYMGVRVTSVIDETRAGKRVWGWAYETLEGHLERGKVTYEVVKDQHTGEVEFDMHGYSQASHTLTPLLRLGWRLFGRRTQLRFYRESGRRMQSLVSAGLRGSAPVAGRDALQVADLVLAPSSTEFNPLDRLAVRRHDPGP